MPEPWFDQITGAYRRMAAEARYRPQAPSDGCGNISCPVEELDLDLEADEYGFRWWREEEDCQYAIGCANYPTRPALIFAVEAARCLCGTQDDVALRLLRMAVAALEETT